MITQLFDNQMDKNKPKKKKMKLLFLNKKNPTTFV